jgi:hypothetical protein
VWSNTSCRGDGEVADPEGELHNEKVQSVPDQTTVISLELSFSASSVLPAGTQPLPKRVLLRVRYNASWRCALFWVVMQLVTDVSGQPIGPKLNGRNILLGLDMARPG